jgi:branched-chain amino acid transport system ATP-binding protein
MLDVEHVEVGYGDAVAIWDVSLAVGAGELVTVVGPNGAGKTTLIDAIAGLLPLRAGRVRLDAQDLASVPPHALCGHGIALVPEGRRLFPRLTVEENLLLGAYRPGARADIDRNLPVCFEAFPVLRERRRQLAGSMSGGEQQMLAIARALMSSPKILLVDEPSVGLAPILVTRVIAKIRELKERYQLTVLMAEQNFNQATKIADRGYIIVHGKIEFEGRNTRELRENDLVKKYYLGV